MMVPKSAFGLVDGLAISMAYGMVYVAAGWREFALVDQKDKKWAVCSVVLLVDGLVVELVGYLAFEAVAWLGLPVAAL